MEKRNLRHLVREAAGGRTDAAAALFDHYHPRLYRYALVKLASEPDAEDVASETFARVLGELDRFRWRGAGFEAWLFRIAANLVTDRARERGRILPGDIATEELTPVESLPDSLAVAKEQTAEVVMMMNGLPADQREVLVLRFAAGLDTDQVGKIMGRNANAVRQLQFRALTAMRNKMEQGAAT